MLFIFVFIFCFHFVKSLSINFNMIVNVCKWLHLRGCCAEWWAPLEYWSFPLCVAGHLEFGNNCLALNNQMILIFLPVATGRLFCHVLVLVILKLHSCLSLASFMPLFSFLQTMLIWELLVASTSVYLVWALLMQVMH